MELFRDDGCLTDEGLRALTAGQLDELGRLEAAEHLSYCDRCLDRYTALLTGGALEAPPHDLGRPVNRAILTRLMNNLYGRAAVASVAAVLALTFWRSGALGLTLGRDAPSLEMYVPGQVAPPAADSIPEAGFDQPPRPGERGAGALTRRAYEAVSSLLDGLAAPDTARH